MTRDKSTEHATKAAELRSRARDAYNRNDFEEEERLAALARVHESLAKGAA